MIRVVGRDMISAQTPAEIDEKSQMMTEIRAEFADLVTQLEATLNDDNEKAIRKL